MKKLLLVIILLLSLNICFANDYTRIEDISPYGKYIFTPEYCIEVWEYDTDKSSCWIPSDRLIITPKGYVVNIDRDEAVRIINIELR